MQIKIKMTNLETNESVFVFDKIVKQHDAVGMVRRLNEINAECAKITGKAVKFFYSITLR